MVEKSKTSGGGLMKFLNFIPQVLPIIIIGGLLYAGFFVKAEAVITKVQPKPIEKRDYFFSIAAPSEQIAWAAGTAGKVVRTEDGGKTWVAQKTKTLENLQGIAVWDAQTAVVVGNRGVILHTADGGTTWKPSSVPVSSNPNKLFRARIFGDTAWAVGEFNGLFRSDDKGATWTRVLPERDRALNSVAFVGQVGVAVGEAGLAMRSTDGGATWSDIQTDNPASLMTVAFRDDQHAVAVGLTGTVMTTSNAGESWTIVPNPTREHLFDVAWYENKWIAVGDKGVQVSSDADAKDWKSGKIFEGDVAWRTQMVKQGSRDYVVGANLAILEGGKLAVVGR